MSPYSPSISSDLDTRPCASFSSKLVCVQMWTLLKGNSPSQHIRSYCFRPSMILAYHREHFAGWAGPQLPPGGCFPSFLSSSWAYSYLQGFNSSCPFVEGTSPFKGKKEWARDTAQLVECWPNMHEVLHWVPAPHNTEYDVPLQ